MKVTSKALLILFTVILISACSSTSNLQPTEPSKEPVEGANTIILVTDLSKDEAYRQVAQAMSDYGLTLANTDATLRIITTEYRANEGFYDYSYKLTASIRGDETTEIHIKGTGLSKSWSGGNTEYQASNKYSSSKPFAEKIWENILEIAQEISHRDILYRIS